MLRSILSRYKYFIILLLSIVALGVIGICIFLLPPHDHADNLRLMKLNKDTVPIFKMAPQLLYTPSSSTELEDLLNDALKVTDMPDGLSSHINMAFYINDALVEAIAQDLNSYASSISKLTLSLLSSENLTEEAYISLYEKLYGLMDKDLIAKTEFILYPGDLSQLDRYDDFKTSFSIGVSMNTLDDFKTLDAISEHFKSVRPLYVRENFMNTCTGTITEVSKEINAFYYVLAIRYPHFTGIFSPFLRNPLAVEDGYVLQSSDPNYTAYQTIYGRLLQEPWLTTEDISVGDNSPYALLHTYDILTGTEELILSPDSTLLVNVANDKSLTYTNNVIHYRLEEEGLTIQNYYPYVVQIDTTTQPNGITRFKAIASDHGGQVLDVHSIDLMIHNANTSLRATRYLHDVTFDTQPGYGSSYIPILMYHSIADEVAVEDNNHTVQTELFDQQMKALVDHGYTPINFKMLQEYLEGANGLPEKPILITMDDGYLNNYTHAYPVYKKYNISATLFVSAYYMEEENTDRHFGWSAAKEMEDSGLIDIQSHGYNHTPLPYLSVKDLKYHLSKSKELIEKHLGARDVFVVAYPQFRNTFYTRELLSDLGVDFQITNLAKVGTGLNTSDLKRINVPNTMSPEELITAIEKLTR